MLVGTQNPRARYNRAHKRNKEDGDGPTMSELEVCAAALFLSKGKDVVTEKEFSMTIAMDLRWMSKPTADGLLKLLTAENVVTVKDGYVRPTFDINSVKVPLGFKPGEDVKKRASDAGSSKSAKPAAPKDVFSVMKSLAAEHGIEGKDFMAKCREISKTLGITQTAAGLVVLNEAGVDVSNLTADVEKDIRENQ